MYKLCTNAPSDSSITIGNETFTKEDVTGLNLYFGNEQIIKVTDIYMYFSGDYDNETSYALPEEATNRELIVEYAGDYRSPVQINGHTPLHRTWKFTVKDGCGSGGQDFVKYDNQTFNANPRWNTWNYVAAINVGQIKYRIPAGISENLVIPVELVGIEMDNYIEGDDQYDYRYKSLACYADDELITNYDDPKELHVTVPNNISAGTSVSLTLSTFKRFGFMVGETAFSVGDTDLICETEFTEEQKEFYFQAESNNTTIIDMGDPEINIELQWFPGTANDGTIVTVVPKVYCNDPENNRSKGYFDLASSCYDCSLSYNDVSFTATLEITDTPSIEYGDGLTKEFNDYSDAPIVGFTIKFSKVDHSDNYITTNIEFEIYDAGGENHCGITSLKNFGRNFVNLTSLNTIPPGITGEGCLENFLRGCKSFNKPLSVPTGCTGNNALKYFLRDCTNFNSRVTLPSGLTGNSVLYGFLYGCTKFNQTVSIPASVTGNQCLERFLYGCSAFNKAITIPTDVNGYACLRDFLTECISFNQPITLPNDVGSYGPMKDDVTGNYIGRELCNFMKNCHAMCSTITVPALTAQNCQVSEQTLSSTRKSSKIYTVGVTVAGAGVNVFLNKVSNSYDIDEYPYRHYTNLDE